MTDFIPTHNDRKKIYNEHLQLINNISFTLREMDIVACILHNRGEKKIASLLSISPKTVGTHIHNIMLKLGYGSRDYIIDFIEKSGKLLFVKKYYLHLLIFASFEQRLREVGKTVNKQNILCSIEYEKVNDEVKQFFHTLKEHLKLANITLIETDNYIEEIKYNLYVLSEKSLFFPLKSNQLFLKLDNIIELSANDEVKYIDYSKEENYYFATLSLLQKIINKKEIEKIIQEFNSNYQAIKNSWEGSNKEVSVPDNQKLQVITKNKKIIYLIGVILLIGVLAIIIKNKFNSANITSNPKEFNNSSITNNIHEEFANFIKNLSASNITKELRQKNHSLIQQVEDMVMLLINNKEQSQSYFSNINMAHDKLIDCLYVLQALANYYTHHEHDGEKARKILEYEKELAENYVIIRSKVPIDFDKLDKEEIYTELSIVKDLPEIYTKIIYLLGRTYIYQAGDKELVIKYFELSKYLGNKLNLFIGYLSERSGLGIIKGEEINIDIKNHSYTQAKQKLNEIIKLYKELKYNNIKYQSGDIQAKVIIPNEDIYNVVECGEQIVKYYAKLILITDDNKHQASYVKEISDQFIGNKEETGLLFQSKKIDGKKRASLYNTLGNILLVIYDKHLDMEQLKNEIIKELNLSEGDDLEVIKQIFNLAKSLARNTEFTKADSYDGLIKVYQRQINQGHLKKEQENELLIIIKDFQNKRDMLNKELKRTRTSFI